MKILLLLIVILIMLILIFYFINCMFKLFGGKWRTFMKDDSNDKLFFILMNLFYFDKTLIDESNVEKEFNEQKLTIKPNGKTKYKSIYADYKWILREMIYFDNLTIKHILRNNIREEIITLKKDELKQKGEKDGDIKKQLRTQLRTINANVEAKMKEENNVIGKEIIRFKNELLMARKCIPSYISFILTLNSYSSTGNEKFLIPFTKKYENTTKIDRLPYKIDCVIPFHTIMKVYIIGYNKKDEKNMYPAIIKDGKLKLDTTHVLNWNNGEYTNHDSTNEFILKLWNDKTDIEYQNEFDDDSKDVGLQEIGCIEELLLFETKFQSLYRYYVPTILTNKTPEYTKDKDDSIYKPINLCTMFSLTPKIQMIGQKYLNENMNNYIKYLLEFSEKLHENKVMFCDWKIEQFGLYEDKIVCVDTGLNRMDAYIHFNQIPKTYLGGRSIYYDLNYISMHETGTNEIRNYIYDEFFLFIDLYNTLYHSSHEGNGFKMNNYYEFIHAVSTSFFNATKYIYKVYNGFLNKHSKINMSYVYVDKLLKMTDIDSYEQLRDRIIHFQCLIWLITKHSEPESNIEIIENKLPILLDILTNEGTVEYNNDNTFNSIISNIHKNINEERINMKLDIFKEVHEMTYEYIRQQHCFQEIINNEIKTIKLKYTHIDTLFIYGVYEVIVDFNNITKINVKEINKKIIPRPCNNIHPI